MLNQRILSAAILLPIVIALLVLGGWPYRLLVLVVALLAGYELVRMFRKKGYQLSIIWMILMIVAWDLVTMWPAQAWSFPALTVVILGLTLRELLATRRTVARPNPTEQWALVLAGGTYLGVGSAHLMRLRALPDGLWWTLTTLLVVWIGDSAAYFAGSRWGRHKMAPMISPGKSWEGYAAQVMSGPVFGLLLAWLWPVLFGSAGTQDVTLTPWLGLILGALVSVLCPVGDFMVSMMKREVGVKDTGSLIPGHGGVLDRIDSVLWAGILAHLLAQVFA